VPDRRHPRGLIDTSAVIEIEQISANALPTEIAVSTITLAELAAGPHATTDPAERAHAARTAFNEPRRPSIRSRLTHRRHARMDASTPRSSALDAKREVVGQSTF